MILRMDPLSNLNEAQVLASIRNQCRHLLTNNQEEINASMQTAWFNQIYIQQNPQNYWIWLLKEIDQQEEAIIGYFAVKEAEEGMYVTEGLLETKRGMGLGSFMLNAMISNELFNKSPLLADIFNHNHPSVRLHKKFGFKEYQKVSEQVTRYILPSPSC